MTTDARVVAARAAMVPLIGWCETGRAAIERAIVESGLPPQMPVDVVIATLKNPEGSGLEYTQKQREVSILKAPVAVARVMDRVVWPDPQPLRAGAAELHRLLGDQVRFWSSWQSDYRGLVRPGADFTADPVEWIHGHVLVPIFWHYLFNLTDPRRPDAARLGQLLDEAALFLVSNNWRSEDLLSIAGLVAATSLTHQDVSIRPATAEEIGEWCEFYPEVQAHAGLRRVEMGPRQVPTHVLSVGCTNTKDVRPLPGMRCHQLLLALQVLGFRPSAPGPKTLQIHPPWSAQGQSWHPVVLPEACIPKPFSTSDLAAAHALASKIPVGALGEPRNRVEIALHRFRAALQREQPVDVLLDVVIALEAILLVDTQGELSYRFSLRGATWLEATPADRRRCYDELHDLYGLRSKVVHGSKFPDSATIVAASAKAIDIAQRVLLKGLRDGWPTAADFDRLALE